MIGSKWRSSVLRFAADSDCIPIVGSVKSLVLNDKRFNHTKVWCTFIFIDLQLLLLVLLLLQQTTSELK